MKEETREGDPTHWLGNATHRAVSSVSHQAKGAINRQKVHVLVIEAKGLIGSDGLMTKTSDPFATVIVRNRGQLKQTSTKMKTLAPTWNEEFEL
jgi:Ca2+-dependent lipid-binding protein